MKNYLRLKQFGLLCVLTLWQTLAMAGQIPLTITEDAGIDRQPGWVTSGVPFPMGAVKTVSELRLADAQGQRVPLQVQATATWRDGSVKWALVDFPCEVPAAGTRQYQLEYGSSAAEPGREITPKIHIEDTPQELRVNTGPLLFSIAKQQFGIFDTVQVDANRNGTFEPEENRMANGLRQKIQLGKEHGYTVLRVLPPDEVKVEEPGPGRAVIKVSGWMDDGSTNRLVQYLWRIHAYAGSAEVKVHYTTIQLSDTVKMLWVADHALEWATRLGSSARLLMGGQPTFHDFTLQPDQSIQLTQIQEGGYTLKHPAGNAAGFKAPGWLGLSGDRGGVFFGARHFWQQFPKTLAVKQGAPTPDATLVRLGLYPQECGKALDMDQGLAKTHEFSFVFTTAPLKPEQCAAQMAAFDHPLFAIAPTQWYCNSEVFGDLLPFDFDRFPEYETLTEASGDQIIKKMATGWRHWGDLYYGGEYKGTNSYMNLEYDVHHNFYCQFARTGLRKYLDAAITMAKHQVDIDTNHKTGWQWKHSPRHVETRAEFGHTFTRGLLETWFLTGNRRCLEAAVELGNFFTQAIRNPRELGNERQIGWSLISLLPVYEATWDKKYFTASQETIDRLINGLEDKGKFSIRWDNRISFFNGIAATGFIYYQRATGDERVAEAILKVMRRTRGFYPEYAGRTLEAIAWAYKRTREPEYLDLLQRTWETTLARQISWNTMELGAPTIFTVHALPFLAESGFLSKAEKPLNLFPAQFATENGLYAHHLPHGEADLFLNVTSEYAFDLVVIRKGAWKASGTATLYDPAGEVVANLDFPKEGVVWQRRVVPVQPKQKGAYRLAMRSISPVNVKGGSYITWDVATSRPIQAVFSTPEYQGLQFVTPYLYTVPKGDTSRIELELTGEGEGFKKAVILDPDGHVAGSSEAFIDLGDKGRYFYKVSATIPPHQMNKLWRISLQEVSMTKMSGLSPYFATSKQAFFQPDKAAGQ